MNARSLSVWPAPRELNSSGPAFPGHALPQAVGPFVHSVAHSMQVPLDLAAAFALGALATAGARTALVQVRAEWVEPLNLFIGLVTPPGQRKSPVFKAMTAPIAAFEAELLSAKRPEFAEARAKKRRLDKELKSAEAADDWSKVQSLELELEQLLQAPPIRLFTSDATAQSLSSLLAAHGRVAVLSAEPSIFGTMAGRWAKNAPAELDVFLQGHAGDALRVDRVQRPSERCESPALTVCLGLQPSALKSLAAVPGAQERGLLARFVWVLPGDVRGTRDQVDRPIPAAHRAAYDACLKRMLGYPVGSDARPEPRISLSPAATQLETEFSAEIERRVAPLGDLRNLDGWSEKLAGLTARLAGLFHVAEEGPTGSISGETYQQAIDIAHWAIQHAKLAFQQMGSEPAASVAEDILTCVKRKRFKVCTQRDLNQAMKGKKVYAKVEALEPGLQLLLERGWARVRETPAKDGPGRDVSTPLEFHPSIWGSHITVNSENSEEQV